MITPDRQSISGATIDSLVAALSSRDGLVRQQARLQLVERGHEGVGRLIHALKDPRHQVRWEAAKALGAIADPAATGALAQALTDDDGDVRWLAAEGLIDLERAGVWAVLERLTHHPELETLRESAHHVLHARFGQEMDALLAPVLEALEGPSPETAVAVAAYQALSRGRRERSPIGGENGRTGATGMPERGGRNEPGDVAR